LSKYALQLPKQPTILHYIRYAIRFAITETADNSSLYSLRGTTVTDELNVLNIRSIMAFWQVGCSDHYVQVNSTQQTSDLIRLEICTVVIFSRTHPLIKITRIFLKELHAAGRKISEYHFDIILKKIGQHFSILPLTFYSMIWRSLRCKACFLVCLEVNMQYS